MTYNVFSGTLNLAQSHWPSLRGRKTGNCANNIQLSLADMAINEASAWSSVFDDQKRCSLHNFL